MLNGVALAMLTKCSSPRVWVACSDLPILYLRPPFASPAEETERSLNVSLGLGSGELGVVGRPRLVASEQS